MKATLEPEIPATTRCAACGSEIAAGLLACPGCSQLVHADELTRLMAVATTSARASDRPAELAAWSAALGLLPAGSKQHRVVAAKIASLGESVPARDRSSPPASPSPSPTAPRSRFWRWAAGLGPVGALLFKLKFLFVALLGNAKLVLLGLTKAGTIFSMLLTIAVYFTAWGLSFALLFVLSIYIHEMGHVVALRRYGIAATAPMFVPGLGAFIRLRQAWLPPAQNARVGLAGPLWGLVAAAVSLALSTVGGPLWMAIAHTGAWLNLFNLLPVWQLDGNRAFSALGRTGRLGVAAAFVAAWLFTGNGLIAILAIVSVARTIDRTMPDDTDAGVWAEFAGVIAGLALILRISAVTP